MTLTVADRRFLVIGAGQTGQSVAAFLTRHGGLVRLAERSRDKLAAAVLPAGIDVRAGDDAADLLRGIDVVIPSPGVPRSHFLLQRALAQCIPILSEIELAARFLTCPILAVSGTNGMARMANGGG